MWGSGAGRWGRVSSLQFWAWTISIPYRGLFFSKWPYLVSGHQAGLGNFLLRVSAHNPPRI